MPPSPSSGNPPSACPEIPGSYMTPRYLINSIRLVVNNSAPVRDTLLHWNEKINNEITLKRKEFGFT